MYCNYAIFYFYLYLVVTLRCWRNMLWAWLVTDWPHTSVAVEVCLLYHRILGISFSFVCVIQIVRRTDPENMSKRSHIVWGESEYKIQAFWCKIKVGGLPLWGMLESLDDSYNLDDVVGGGCVVGWVDADLPLWTIQQKLITMTMMMTMVDNDDDFGWCRWMTGRLQTIHQQLLRFMASLLLKGLVWG